MIEKTVTEIIEAGTFTELIEEFAGVAVLDAVVSEFVDTITGGAIIDETAVLSTLTEPTAPDAGTPDEPIIIELTSDDGTVTGNIPLDAIPPTPTAISVTIEPVADLTALLKNLMPAASDEATTDQPTDEPGTGTPVILTQGLTILDVVSIRAQDQTAGAITLFALIQVPTIQHTFVAGLNPLVFTGADKTSASDFADEIGPGLSGLFRFNARQQLWESHLPGAPSFINTLREIRQRDPIMLAVQDGLDIGAEFGDIIPTPSGVRNITLEQGLNAVAFAGPDRMSLTHLLSGTPSGKVSVSRLDSANQQWEIFLPGVPSAFSDFSTVDHLDALFMPSNAGTTLSMPDGR